MIQSALVARLKTVHSGTYASSAPQSAALPVVVVDLESSFRSRHYGSAGLETGLKETDFEISVWSQTVDGCYTLAQSIISDLENLSGPLLGGDSPQTSYRICDVEITSELSGLDGETKIYQYSIFLTITHTEG